MVENNSRNVYVRSLFEAVISGKDLFVYKNMGFKL